MLPAIEVSGLSKRFRLPTVRKRGTIKDLVVRTIRHEGRLSIIDALDDVHFKVERGTTLGIIGRNGSGKSTLLRILAGIVRPDQGEVRIHGSVAPLLALGSGFHPDLTGREGARIELLALGLTRKQTEGMMDRVISFSEIGEFIDQPVRTYSSGMLARLAFSVAVSVDPDVLLLDEILAVGDEAFARKCLEYLTQFKRAGKTIVLVAHASEILRTWCDRVLWIDEGRVRRYGEPREVIGAYHMASGIEIPLKPFTFTCNACGVTVPLAKGDELSRESGRCAACGSFVRLRAIVHLISEHLFGRSIPVPDWPERRDIAVLGVNDPAFFGTAFADKIAYANTRCDPQGVSEHPFLDLKAPDPAFVEQADIVISCDTLQYVGPPAQAAFDGLFSLLRPGGLLVLTSLYTFEDTVEHFPDLNDWRVESHLGDRVLVNTTVDGQRQVHRNLRFHNGPVDMPEMRLFGLRAIKNHLREAGFTDIRLFDEDRLEPGIAFSVPWALPITARRPLSFSAPTDRATDPQAAAAW